MNGEPSIEEVFLGIISEMSFIMRNHSKVFENDE
jgi:hypothetical protein